MASVSFESIRFISRPGAVRLLFQDRYYFEIPQEDIAAIGEFTVTTKALEFPSVSQNYAEKRMGQLIDAGFTRLTHILYDKPTVYVYKGSGIPLIGTNEFGIIDRGSNTIEIKPITGCNFTCPYCSVDEGKNDKTHDYLVELEYLLEVAAEVAKTKQHPVEFHIGPQGEPMLYPKFLELVRGLKAIPNCAIITVVTNGSLLTKERIDALAEAGLDKINLSLNAATQETADLMAGRSYPLENVLEMVTYCKGKIKVILAPTIVPGFNDNELEGLVQIGKTIEHEYPPVAFQNFLEYNRGRNPAKPRSFEEFFAMLKPLEEKHDIQLTDFSKETFNVHDEPELPKPFRKRQVVTAKIVCPSRYPNEIIAAAQGRCITVNGPRAHLLPLGKTIKVQIVRDKHNIFRGIVG